MSGASIQSRFNIPMLRKYSKVFQSCLEGFQEQRVLEDLQEHLRECSRKRTREIELMRELRGENAKILK